LHTTDDALGILRRGTVDLLGLFRLGSNDTFLCDVRSAAGSLKAVYKPVRGERPLWDFPAGSLGKREAAAFEAARLLGWDFVPPTVFRADGPLGAGSFQEFLDLDLEQNYFLLREQDPGAMRRVTAFDIVINNADRKAMHVARDTCGAIWLIDHGVCFHEEWKLRTVAWDFAGEPLPEVIRRALEGILETGPDGRIRRSERLDASLAPYLSREEIDAVKSRTKALLTANQFPLPGPGRSIPWPLWA